MTQVYPNALLILTRIDPTHGTENTLDLMFTNRPNSVASSVVAPGISDHFTPVVEMDVSPVRVLKKPREVPMFKSAQWEEFAAHVHPPTKSLASLAIL